MRQKICIDMTIWEIPLLTAHLKIMNRKHFLITGRRYTLIIWSPLTKAHKSGKHIYGMNWTVQISVANGQRGAWHKEIHALYSESRGKYIRRLLNRFIIN